jgi:hypothetical protein
VRHGERERLRQLGDDLEQPLLAVLLGEHVLLRSGQQGQRRAAGEPLVHALQSKPWKMSQHTS